MKNGLCVGILFILLAGGLYAEPTVKEKQYYAIYLGPAKLGYLRTIRAVDNDKVITTTRMKLSIQREKMTMVIIVSNREMETLDGKPLSFISTQNMSGMEQRITGKVQPDGKVKISTESGGQTKEKIVPWPKGALLSEGLRLMMIKKGLAPGTKYDALAFDPESAASQSVSVTVGEKQNVDILGRVTELHKVTQVFIMGGAPLNIVNYVDEDFNAQKIVTGVMGMEMIMVACDRAFAMSPCNSDIDFLKQLSLASPVNIPSDAKKVKYTIEPLDKKELNFPQAGNQTACKTADGLYEVTVTACDMPKGAKFPYAGNDKDILKALQPSSYVQSDAAEIKKLSAQAVGNTKDAAEAVKNIQNFTRNYISQKNLSVGFASALEVAASKTGDCSEHAVFAAALCRAAGIPARLVFGIVYVNDWLNYKNVFVGHAWVLAYVGDKWVPLDAAVPVNQTGHIILAVGDGAEGPAQFFAMSNLLGYFKFKEIDVEK